MMGGGFFAGAGATLRQQRDSTFLLHPAPRKSFFESGHLPNHHGFRWIALIQALTIKSAAPDWQRCGR